MSYPSFKIDLPQEIKKKVLKNVKHILDTGMLSTGVCTQACEAKIKEMIGSRYVYMTSSGSTALESCAYALKKKWGLGTVLMPMNTFMATTNAFRRMGFNVVYYENGFKNVFARELPLVDDLVGIVIVELGGIIPHDIKNVVKEMHKNGVWVCEDACQAYGSHLNGKKAGNFGDIASVSFFSTKVLTSGEGGAVVTNDPTLAESIRMYRNFGKDEEWISYHYEEGWNCRMNEFGSAALLPQLELQEEILENRSSLEGLYRNALKGTRNLAFIHKPLEWYRFNGYKVMLYLDKKIDKKGFIEFCTGYGVRFQGNVYDWILPEQPVFLRERIVFDESWRSELERFVCLPAWYGMDKKEVKDIANVLKLAAKQCETK